MASGVARCFFAKNLAGRFMMPREADATGSSRSLEDVLHDRLLRGSRLFLWRLGSSWLLVGRSRLFDSPHSIRRLGRSCCQRVGSQAGLQVKRHRCIPMFLPQKPCLVLHFDFLLHQLPGVVQCPHTESIEEIQPVCGFHMLQDSASCHRSAGAKAFSACIIASTPTCLCLFAGPGSIPRHRPRMHGNEAQDRCASRRAPPLDSRCSDAGLYLQSLPTWPSTRSHLWTWFPRRSASHGNRPCSGKRPWDVTLLVFTRTSDTLKRLQRTGCCTETCVCMLPLNHTSCEAEQQMCEKGIYVGNTKQTSRLQTCTLRHKACLTAFSAAMHSWSCIASTNFLCTRGRSLLLRATP